MACRMCPAPGRFGCVTLSAENFPLPLYSGGRVGVGVYMNIDWPTKPPPWPSPGVPGEGKRMACRMCPAPRPIWVRDTFCGEFSPSPCTQGEGWGGG